MDTELVLGVAIAPAALGLVLVRGQRADGLLLDRDLIRTTAVTDTAKRAILRTYSTAAKHGYRIHAVDVAHVGVDAAVASQLVAALNQLGVRNVVAVDPAFTDSLAAMHALEIVSEPEPSARPAARGRHRRATSPTARRLALGAAVTGVLAAMAATVVVHASSTGGPPPQAPPSISEPASAVPASRSAVPTPRSIFIGSEPQPRSPATVSVAPASEAPPISEPEAPTNPPPDGAAHLPAGEDVPRPPGPA